MASPISPHSHPQGSSTPSAGAVDNRDFYRIGGPTRLPNWPVLLGPSSKDLSSDLWEALLGFVMKQLSDHEIEFERILPCQRWTDGQSPTFIDDTVYITTTSAPDRGRWFSFMELAVGAALDLGFKGRVEMIYGKAAGGVRSFPPRFSEYHRQNWGEIEEFVAKQLTNANIRCDMMMPANRGYWEGISELTIVVTMRQFVPRDLLTAAEDSISKEIAHHKVLVEISCSAKLWGLFSGESNSPSLFSREPDRPFTRTYNTTGMSLSRLSCSGYGTLGGYLELTDRSGKNRTMGLTCYHTVRKGPNDETPDTQSTGTITTDWPCQSSASDDIETALEKAKRLADTPTPLDPDPIYQQEANDRRQEGLRKLKDITTFNPNIGNAVVVSGWRNMELPNDLTVLLDWALIEIANAKNSRNLIMGLADDMGKESRQHWVAEAPAVPKISPMPPEGTVLFKKGRATGVTAGVLGGLAAAAARIDSTMPAGLHHRAFIVYPGSSRDNHFARAGDSGAWCLNGKGEVVGLLIGGSEADGVGLVIPMESVVQDIERLCNCDVRLQS